MICPVCKSDMIVVEHKDIELDYCLECGGVWFDSGELTLLLKSMDLESQNLYLKNIINSPEAESQEKKQRCPLCGYKMKKVIMGQQPGLLIDVCDRGDGLWFDGGELSQLLKQLAEKPEGKQGSQQEVINFLQEVFLAPE